MNAPKRVSLIRFAVALAAVALAAVSIWQLEGERQGLVIESTAMAGTPITVYRKPDAAAPLVVVAHGFAGSRQLMEAYSLSLAKAGYIVVAFDFEGHGRNRTPMSGDVTEISGTTARLIAQTRQIIDFGLQLPGADGRVALLGHSMATDVIIRTALEEKRVGPVIAVSMFSKAVTPDHPRNLLIINGEWESRLRTFAVAALRMLDAQGKEGQTFAGVDDADGVPIWRRAVAAPNVEHVAVLYSALALQEAVDWADLSFGRLGSSQIAATGPWILLLLVATVVLAWPLAGLIKQRPLGPFMLSWKAYAIALLGPMLAAPLLAYFAPTGFLPVLVADYLAVHLLAYGLVQLIILWGLKVPLGPFSPAAAAALVFYGLASFGLALDRYVASFMPHEGRLLIIFAMAIGTIPFMLGDAVLTQKGATIWHRLSTKLAFFASLALAIAIDFTGLFFLILIVPVIVLFFAVFGLMGRWVNLRAGPLAAGLGLGVLLAWSLGVSFPLFKA